MLLWTTTTNRTEKTGLASRRARGTSINIPKEIKIHTHDNDFNTETTTITEATTTTIAGSTTTTDVRTATTTTTAKTTQIEATEVVTTRAETTTTTKADGTRTIETTTTHFVENAAEALFLKGEAAAGVLEEEGTKEEDEIIKWAAQYRWMAPADGRSAEAYLPI
jgi:hypothetical protein